MNKLTVVSRNDKYDLFNASDPQQVTESNGFNKESDGFGDESVLSKTPNAFSNDLKDNEDQESFDSSLDELEPEPEESEDINFEIHDSISRYSTKKLDTLQEEYLEEASTDKPKHRKVVMKQASNKVNIAGVEGCGGWGLGLINPL